MPDNQVCSGRKAGYRAATFRLPPDILDELDGYATRTGTIKGFIVEQALREYFDARSGSGSSESKPESES